MLGGVHEPVGPAEDHQGGRVHPLGDAVEGEGLGAVAGRLLAAAAQVPDVLRPVEGRDAGPLGAEAPRAAVGQHGLDARLERGGAQGVVAAEADARGRDPGEVEVVAPGQGVEQRGYRGLVVAPDPQRESSTSPWPGPSMVRVAIPRVRNSSSHRGNSNCGDRCRGRAGRAAPGWFPGVGGGCRRRSARRTGPRSVRTSGRRAAGRGDGLHAAQGQVPVAGVVLDGQGLAEVERDARRTRASPALVGQPAAWWRSASSR